MRWDTGELGKALIDQKFPKGFIENFRKPLVQYIRVEFRELFWGDNRYQSLGDKKKKKHILRDFK